MKKSHIFIVGTCPTCHTNVLSLCALVILDEMWVFIQRYIPSLYHCTRHAYGYKACWRHLLTFPLYIKDKSRWCLYDNYRNYICPAAILLHFNQAGSLWRKNYFLGTCNLFNLLEHTSLLFRGLSPIYLSSFLLALHFRRDNCHWNDAVLNHLVLKMVSSFVAGHSFLSLDPLRINPICPPHGQCSCNFKGIGEVRCGCKFAGLPDLNVKEGFCMTLYACKRAGFNTKSSQCTCGTFVVIFKMKDSVSRPGK